MKTLKNACICLLGTCLFAGSADVETTLGQAVLYMICFAGMGLSAWGLHYIDKKENQKK